jgi:hypothetical protein
MLTEVHVFGVLNDTDNLIRDIDALSGKYQRLTDWIAGACQAM